MSFNSVVCLCLVEYEMNLEEFLKKNFRLFKWSNSKRDVQSFPNIYLLKYILCHFLCRNKDIFWILIYNLDISRFLKILTDNYFVFFLIFFYFRNQNGCHYSTVSLVHIKWLNESSEKITKIQLLAYQEPILDNSVWHYLHV